MASARSSLLAKQALHSLAHLPRELIDTSTILPLDHNAEHWLRARVAHEDTPSLAQLTLDRLQQFLHGIRIPTLLLHSTDDPFLPPKYIPRQAVKANPHLDATFTDRGGHIGFVAGNSPFRPVFWAEREATRFLAHHLNHPSDARVAKK